MANRPNKGEGLRPLPDTADDCPTDAEIIAALRNTADDAQPGSFTAMLCLGMLEHIERESEAAGVALSYRGVFYAGTVGNA